MISMSLDQCNSFQPPTFDYAIAEQEARHRNRDMLKMLVNMIGNAECERVFKGRVARSAPLPPEIRDFCKRFWPGADLDDAVALLRKEYEDLRTKIGKFAEKWSLAPDEIVSSLKNADGLLLLCFAKDPGKQTFHQHYAAKWLGNLPFVENFRELPARGDGALYLYEGKVISHDDKKGKETSKSIDFAWKYSFGDKTLNFYATHKYTREEGGAQDNQYQDVKIFHAHAKKCVDKNCLFLSITDGPYYWQNDNERICMLNSANFKGTNNLATTIHAFGDHVIPVIENMLVGRLNRGPALEKAAMLRQELRKLEILRKNLHRMFYGL